MAYPTDIIPTRSQLTLRQFASRSESPFTGRVYTASNLAARWEYLLEYTPLQDAPARRILAAIGAAGMGGTVTIPLFDYPGAHGVATGLPKLQGLHAAGSVQLTTDGWTVSVTNILRAGDYVSVNNQLLMVTDDVNSDGGGAAIISVHTPLRSEAADNESVIVDDITVDMQLMSSTTQMSVADYYLRSISVSLIEAV